MNLSKVSELLQLAGASHHRTIVQGEVAECGIACLAMIANSHGDDVDMRWMRQRFGSSLRGANLGQLVQWARELGLATRTLKLDLPDLKQLSLPCMLHWDMNHFVVLRAVRSRSIRISDPALGDREIPMAEVSRSFTGIALEFTRTGSFVEQQASPSLRLGELFASARGLRSGLLRIFGLSLGVQLVGMLVPLYMQMVIDDVLPATDRPLLILMALGFAFVTLLQAGISSLRSLVTVHLSNQLAIQISANLFAHLLRLRLSFFAARHIGDVTSRFGSLDRIREILTNSVIESAVDGILAFGMLAIMFCYSITLAWAALGALALYTALRLYLFRSQRKATEKQISETARRDTHFMESIRSLQGIRLFAREAQRMGVWQNLLANSLNAGIRLSRVTVLVTTLRQVIFGLERILVIYLGANEVMNGTLTAGMLVAFLSFKTRFTDSSSALIDKWQDLRMVGVHLERVSDIALEEPELAADASPGEVEEVLGQLQLQGLAFKYGERAVFSDLNLCINAGESVAIMGPSGSGKSTLLRLLAGLEQPASGDILVDGKRLAGNPGLRRHMAAVMQNDALISGSIAENISFFDEAHDLRRIQEAAMAAGLHADVESMPMRYDTRIGDMGSSLSGGQVQRVLLARALYRKPRILILDEATSHLDVATEAQVNRAVRELAITRIIVAHRLETIRSADRIYMLDAGMLMEVPASALETIRARVAGGKFDMPGKDRAPVGPQAAQAA